jgi:organic radical activating enzyme
LGKNGKYKVLMTQYENHIERVRDKLNGVGCGMCLAKWTQVTIHLHLGRNHSCHHPDTHAIPLKELANNPSALHNTKYKKKRRKEMLEGKRPSECGYCWGVEDNSNHYSDRTFKSAEPWSWPYFEEISNLDPDTDIFPKYVEVAFSNTCNFACSYCGPSFSSKWVQEAEKYGGYPTDDNFNDVQWMKDQGRMPIHHKEHNPYVEAFWKWWPDLYKNLHTFRITGGEPLLSVDTWKVLDYIIDTSEPNRELNLSINTNLGIPDASIDRFIDKILRITENNKVNEFVVFTSVDGWGEQAEYGRNGLVFNQWWDNVNKILSKCPKVTIGVMSTYNALSVPSYSKLVKSIYDLKKEYGTLDRAWTTPITLDASYLRHPQHQTVQVLDTDIWAPVVKEHGELAQSLEEVFKRGDHNRGGVTYGYTKTETMKLKRIYDWMIAPQDENFLNRTRSNFYKFFNAHDERRGTNFIKTFPEYEEFFYKCKEISKTL